MSPDDEAPPQPVEEEDFAALFAASLAPAVFETGQMVQGRRRLDPVETSSLSMSAEKARRQWTAQSFRTTTAS